MPLHDYRCTVCNNEVHDHFKKVDDPAPVCCDISMDQIFTHSASVSVFKEGFFEHLAPDPIYFHNKKDLRKYCRENNLTMDYVE
jgi:hypothetical protein